MQTCRCLWGRFSGTVLQCDDQTKILGGGGFWNWQVALRLTWQGLFASCPLEREFEPIASPVRFRLCDCMAQPDRVGGPQADPTGVLIWVFLFVLLGRFPCLSIMPDRTLSGEGLPFPPQHNLN